MKCLPLFSLCWILLWFSCQQENMVMGVTPPAAEEAVALAMNNPVIRDKFTADPAALVYHDTVFLYTGHDEAPNDLTDDNDQAYLFWGNTKCYYAPLKENMIELAGEIKVVEGLTDFTEAPWIHKRGDWYYLSYAQQFPEKTA